MKLSLQDAPTMRAPIVAPNNASQVSSSRSSTTSPSVSSTSSSDRIAKMEEQLAQQALKWSRLEKSVVSKIKTSNDSIGRSESQSASSLSLPADVIRQVQPSPAKPVAEEQTSVVRIPSGVPQKINALVKDLRENMAANAQLKPFVVRGATAEFRELLAKNIARGCKLRVSNADVVLDPRYSEDIAYALLKEMFTKAESGQRAMIIINAPLFKINPEEPKSVHYKKLALQSFLLDYSRKLSIYHVVAVLIDEPLSYPFTAHYENGGADLLDFMTTSQNQSSASGY
jgi:hypothetical protein